MICVTYSLPPGFSNKHVRVVADIFEKGKDFYNGYMKPGKNINLLIPGGIKTNIRIFVDHKLVKIRVIDPWQKTTRFHLGYLPENNFTGENL